MPATLATVRDEVRRWMKDTDAGVYAVSPLELNRIIEALAHEVDAELDSGQTWTLAAITLVPGTTPPDYALPAGGIEYQAILDLRRASDGYILRRRSQEYISNRRWAAALAPATRVSEYALVQSVSGSSEIITVMFDIVVTQADTIDLLSATSLAASLNSDSAVIPFPRDFMEGFQQGCAARGIAMMSLEDQAKRGFQSALVRGQAVSSPHVANLERAYQKAFKREQLRLIYLQMAMGDSSINDGGW